MQLLSTVLSSAQGLKDGVTLLKVWLRQRELDKVNLECPSPLACCVTGWHWAQTCSSLLQGLGGFNGFLISMLIAFLVSTRKIHTTMSGYQVLRSVLQFLGEAAKLWKARNSTNPKNPLIPCCQMKRQLVAATRPSKVSLGLGLQPGNSSLQPFLVSSSHHGSDR